MFLLDTNIVSEIRKISQNRANIGVKNWVEEVDIIHCYISTITLLEIEQGILRIRHRGDLAQYEQLQYWLDNRVLPTFRGRILAVDEHTVRICAPMNVPDNRPRNDALIAATAIQHNLTLITRNTQDFLNLNVAIYNPFI